MDGELSDIGQQLDDTLANIVHDFRPHRVFTLGPDGYDGHADHIAIHESAVRVIRHVGLLSTLHALDSRHQGEFVIEGSERKLGAMALHASQLIDTDLFRWGGTDVYAPLISRETYTIYDLSAA
jgi:LmbE family N-acetylglucosaminyl deacetylase